MANPEHVALVAKGTDAIIEWWQKNLETEQVLDLVGAKLRNIDLNGANLFRAKFVRADLFHADLFEAYASRCDFADADLRWADLCHADVAGSNLKNAKLCHANMLSADLSEANLSGADLSFANLASANLSGANLSRSNLYAASFFSAKLDRVDFTGARMNMTLLSACDLSQCVGLDTIKHTGPSSIGLDTLVKSFWKSEDRFTPALNAFFLKAGVPEQFLQMMPKMLADVQARDERSLRQKP